MMQGFSLCDPTTALPRDGLAPLGVKYRDRKFVLPLTYPDLLKNQAWMPLQGNDVANTQKDGDNKAYLVYGGKYALTHPLSLGDGVTITAVATMVDAEPPRAVFGMTYFLKQSPSDVIATVDALTAGIGSRVGRVVDPLKASTDDVWFYFNEKARSNSCWRYPDTAIRKQ
jgi:hypothetical protein